MKENDNFIIPFFIGAAAGITLTFCVLMILYVKFFNVKNQLNKAKEENTKLRNILGFFRNAEFYAEGNDDEIMEQIEGVIPHVQQ